MSTPTRRTRAPSLPRAAGLTLLTLVCLVGCQHDPSPSSGTPLGVAAQRGIGTSGPSGIVGQPSPGADNVTCPAFDGATLPAPLPPSPTAAAGTLPGSFAVSAAGQATYTIPITVPPGRLGMEPKLAIAYDSSRGEGPLGVGFALQGLSAITRCPSNLAQDGRIRAVRYDQGDNFCIDGVRLVVVPHSDDADGTGTREWRTFPDTMRRVISHSGKDPILGPDRWTVYERDGRIREYGFSMDSQAMAKGGVVAAWWIHREQDRRGSEIVYSYENDPHWGDGHTQEILPLEIRYSGERKVTFTYDTILPRTLFTGGLSIIRSHLLTKIETWAAPDATSPGERLVRAYHLEYDRGKATRRERLRSVTECAADGACKPATRFGWTDNPPGFSQSVTAVMLPTYAQSVQLDYGFGSWTLADVNGDGLDDLVVVYPNAQNTSMDDWNVALNMGGTFGSPEVWATLPHPATLSEDSTASPSGTGSAYTAHEENYFLTPMDYDQDGITDIVVDTPNPDNSTWPTYMVVESRPKAKLGERFVLHHTAVPQPNGVPFTSDDPDQEKPYSIRYARVGDINGDGIGDLIECSNPRWDNEGNSPNTGDPVWSVRLWVKDVPGVGGPGWDPSRIPIPGTDQLDCAVGLHHVHIVDIDGSGVSAILMPQTGGQYAALRLESTGWTTLDASQTSLPVQSWQPFGNNRLMHWLDVNGDGLPDAVYTGLGTPCAPGGGDCPPPDPHLVNGWPQDVPFVSINNGSFFGEPTGMLTHDLGGKHMTDWEGDQGLHLDYDGDGRTDFALPVFGQCPDGDPDHACYVVLRAPVTGEGFREKPSDPPSLGVFEAIPTPVGEIIDSDTTVPHAWFKPQVTDVDGDGRHDLVAPTLAGDGTFTIYRNSGPQDVLVEIIDGMNPLDPGEPGFVPTVSIKYDSLVDRSILSGAVGAETEHFTYLKHADPTNDCAYPRSCVVGPSRVVSTFAMNDGQNEPRKFSVKYRDGRYHRQGRGMLGFEERIILDEDTGAGRVELYDNKKWDGNLNVFPFAGQVKESWAWGPAIAQPPGAAHPSSKPTEVELSYTYTTLEEVAHEPKTYFTIPTVVEQVHREGTFHPGKGRTLYDFVRDAQLTATVLSDKFSVVEKFDPTFGDVLSARSYAKGVDLEETTTRIVQHSVKHWLLGEVIHEETCSKALGQTQCRRTSRTFNGYGEVTGTVTGDPLDPDTQLTVGYFRDGFGNATLTTAYDNAGHYRSACTSYELEGIFPYATRNPLGHTTLFAYDMALGVLTGSVDPNGLQTHLRYDGFGRLTEEHHPDGSFTTYALARHKNGGPTGTWWNVKVATAVGGGPTSTRELDSLGRTVHAWARVAGTNACGASLCASVLELEQDTTYDHLGRVLRVTVPWMLGDALTGTLADVYDHDAIGRVTRHVEPWGRTTKYAYEGNVVSATDWLGTTKREVDALGRLTKVTDKTEGTVTTAYGPFSFPYTVTRFGSETTTTVRDAYGRVIEEDDPDRGKTVMKYDGFGEVLAVDDAAMRHVAFGYDAVGRLMERDDVIGGKTSVTRWAYDTAQYGVGMLAEVTSPAGHVDTYAYTPRSQLREHTLTFGDTGESFSAAYGHDKYGRVDLVVYPEPAGVDPLTVRREYDAFGNVVALRDDATKAVYWQLSELDGAGRPTKESLGNGVVVTREHAPESGVVTRIRAMGPGMPLEPTLQDLGYAYDLGLRMTSRRDLLQQGLVGPLSEGFGYDAIDRLTCAAVDTSVTKGCPSPIDYAPNGNIQTKDGLAYAYDPAHPHAVQTVGTGSYVHDPVGNQVKRADGTTIAYTPFDLPERYTFKSSTNFLPSATASTEFAYDGGQHRIRKTRLGPSGATIEETAYLDELYERVRSASGDTHRFYVAAGSATAVLTRSSGGSDKTAYALTDALGSVDVITDGSGGVVERRSYDAFGARRNPMGWGPWQGPLTSGTAPIGFAGLEEDDEAGLVNMRGRIYDPKIGRFLSTDPIVSFPGFGQSWNPYSYVLNSPLNFTDPSGFGPDDNGPIPSDKLSTDKPTVTGPGTVGLPMDLITAGPGKQMNLATEHGIGTPREAPPEGAAQGKDRASDDAPAKVAPAGDPAGSGVGPGAGEPPPPPPGPEKGTVRRAAEGALVEATVLACQVHLCAPAGPPTNDISRRIRERLAEEDAKGATFLPIMALENPAAGAVGIAASGAAALEARAPAVLPQLGGSYAQTRAAASRAGLGGEVHHMPSWAATEAAGGAGQTRGSAPSIWMKAADHARTPSFGRAKLAGVYRAQQSALIRAGRYLDALKMDVDAIRAAHGTSYDGAIQQMGEYVWRMGQ